MKKFILRALLGFLAIAVFLSATFLVSFVRQKLALNRASCLDVFYLGTNGLWNMRTVWTNETAATAHGFKINKVNAKSSSAAAESSSKSSLEAAASPPPAPSLQSGWQAYLVHWAANSRIGAFKGPSFLVNLKKSAEEDKTVALSGTEKTKIEEIDETDETKACVSGLGKGTFDLDNPLTVAFARLADDYLSYWTKIEGVEGGLGSRGVIKNRTLQAMAKNIKLLPCVVHIRIKEKRVYFRYGEFLDSRRKIVRANQAVKMIHDAVTDFHMAELETELFVNVCDEPMSYDNSLSPGRSGFPVFSTRTTLGVTDILIPDPLDLDFSPVDTQTKWEEMEAVAYFRGPSTNFQIKMHNYGSSAQFRLHYLSDERPDLLDARITMWGSTDQPDTKQALIRDGFYLAPDLSDKKKSKYKYRIVVDDAVGSSAMCQALSGQQVALKQNSPFLQFFDRLLLPGVHYIPVAKSFQNLFSTIEWMRKNDKWVKSVVKKANEVTPLFCTWKSRTLFWAIMLSKYTELALEDVHRVDPPAVCPGEAIFEPASLGETCRVQNNKCGDFCTRNSVPQQWAWLSSDALLTTRPLDPLGTRYSQQTNGK